MIYMTSMITLIYRRVLLRIDSAKTKNLYRRAAGTSQNLITILC